MSPNLRAVIPEAVFRGGPTVWINPSRAPVAEALAHASGGATDVAAAADRWRRFAPILAELFAGSVGADGRIESPLVELSPALSAAIAGSCADGPVLVKADHALPLTGSIKARGGVYEVLVHAEAIGRDAGLVGADGNLAHLRTPAARVLFNGYRIVVGSTGNLGFSVGLAARGLGFQAEVHMSADAKAWKKARLRDAGVSVVEHAGDYAIAVAAARRKAAADPYARFVDDERSEHLFFGYATAAAELQQQLDKLGVRFGPEAPLTVLLPCGVGGAPGGVTFGLKLALGDAVRCVFVEPVEAPCVLVQLAAGLETPVSVYDIGRSNRTEADGLAVPQASLFVLGMVRELVDAVATVTDESLFLWARRIWLSAELKLEPSAAAGFAAAASVSRAFAGAGRAAARGQLLVWTTGGGLLPAPVFDEVLARGAAADSAADLEPRAPAG